MTVSLLLVPILFDARRTRGASFLKLSDVA
jgi:hypothetical protein